MEVTKKHVELFMVASFLIKNHGYRFVTVHQHEDELWLGNPSNTEFPVIRISSTTVESVYFDRNRIMSLHSAISKALKTEARLLDIHISNETVVEADDDFEQTVLNQGNLYGKNIATHFPLIKNAITPFDDPKKEFARLNRDLEVSMAQKRKQKKKLSWRSKVNATNVITAVCILVYLLNHAVANFGGYMQSSASIALGCYYRGAVTAYHQYWRFLTVGFHHLSIWHLLMNLSSLRAIGPQLEQFFGWKKFLGLLFFSIVSGSIFMHTLDNTVFAVGLSGGLYGCLAVWLVYAYTRGLFRVPTFRSHIFQMIMMNLLINFMPNVAVTAHLGGFVGGLIVGVILVDYKPWKSMKKHMVIAYCLIVAFIGWRWIDHHPEPELYMEDIEMVEIYYDANMDFYADHLSDKIEEYYGFNIKEIIQ